MEPLRRLLGDGAQANGAVDDLQSICSPSVRPAIPLAPSNLTALLRILSRSSHHATLLPPPPSQRLMKMVGEIYSPLIVKNAFAFKKKMTAENVEQLKATTDSFCATLDNSIKSLEMTVSLQKPEKIASMSAAGIAAVELDGRWTPEQAAEYAARRDFRLAQLLASDPRARATARAGG